MSEDTGSSPEELPCEVLLERPRNEPTDITGVLDLDLPASSSQDNGDHGSSEATDIADSSSPVFCTSLFARVRLGKEEASPSRGS